ncbi:MAG: 3-methyl-2-oxobutanoate hydroxymethyltransferase [bacterium]
MKLWNVERIRTDTYEKKLACVTVYDYTSAKLADAAGFPLLLVGDSLGMTMLGFPTTLPVTLEMMLHHTAAVVRGVSDALVVADMPFLTYQVSVSEGIRNAGRFLQEAGADAVKIEGGAIRADLISALTQNGIPVLGHIGLTPQSVNQMGGYKVQGRTQAAAEQLIQDARILEQAGAFGVVLECIPPDVAESITASLDIPTIGIGAGPGCDGQILVMNDLLGLSTQPPAKFVKPYAALAKTMQEAFAAYIQEVQNGTFPSAEHCYARIS